MSTSPVTSANKAASNASAETSKKTSNTTQGSGAAKTKMVSAAKNNEGAKKAQPKKAESKNYFTNLCNKFTAVLSSIVDFIKNGLLSCCFGKDAKKAELTTEFKADKAEKTDKTKEADKTDKTQPKKEVSKTASDKSSKKDK